jgi:2'-hydroxyisoflavone reductase
MSGLLNGRLIAGGGSCAPLVLGTWIFDGCVFISSLSVYADVSVFGIDETAPIATLTSEQLDQASAIDSSGQVSAVTYGKMYGLKALCEQAAAEVLPNRVLIIRPGLIIGPDDYSDRFTY